MKSSVILTVMLILALLATSCGVTCGTTNASTLSGSPAAGKGYVNILVTDAPPQNTVTSIMVTVSSISVHIAGTETTTVPTRATATTTATATATTSFTSTATTSTSTTSTVPTTSSDEGGKWISIPVSGPNPFDLLKLQGIDELLGTAQLQAGRYTQIRLVLTKVEVALGGGELQEATVPSGELKFVRPFDVIAGETTDIELDFDAQKSVNVTGSGKVTVKPVVKLTITNKSSNELTSISGAVNAVNAQASTITILPTGQTQPVVLGMTPQTVIILNDDEVTLSGLATLPSGSIATVSYYLKSLKVVRIEIVIPQTTSADT